MKRQFGPLCPDGHGLLVSRDEWTTQGVIWCPHEDHGGNGRFYRTNEVEDGWFSPDSTTKTPEQIARAEHSAEIAAKRKEIEMTKASPTQKAAPKPRKAKEPRECTCGCGGMTKGGRFLPGHDAKYHSALKKAEAGAAPEKSEAKVPTRAATRPKRGAVSVTAAK